MEVEAEAVGETGPEEVGIVHPAGGGELDEVDTSFEAVSCEDGDGEGEVDAVLVVRGARIDAPFNAIVGEDVSHLLTTLCPQVVAEYLVCPGDGRTEGGV